MKFNFTYDHQISAKSVQKFKKELTPLTLCLTKKVLMLPSVYLKIVPSPLVRVDPAHRNCGAWSIINPMVHRRTQAVEYQERGATI